MGSTLQDLRFAIRQLRKSPGFAVTAVMVFALGVGAATAIFAFVDAAFLKPLTYRDPPSSQVSSQRAEPRRSSQQKP